MGAAASVKSPVSETSIVPVESLTTKRLVLKGRRTDSKKQAKKIPEPIRPIQEQRKEEASRMKKKLSVLVESETEGADECEIDGMECQLYHPCYVPSPYASN